MLLDGKNAVIYGGGAIGGAVARAFARVGARNVAAVVASDKACTVTAATANISCGALID